MKIKLKNKLILNFLFVIFICIAIIWILSNMFLEKRFNSYIITKQKSDNQKLLDQIKLQYSDKYGWNVSSVEKLGVDELSQGIIIKLTDTQNNVIWDAKMHNSGLCAQMLDHIAQNMQSKYPNFNGKYSEQVNGVIVQNQKIANLYIGYYGPFFYTDADLEFLNKLNYMLVFSALISTFISVILAVILSKNITKPIEEIIDKTYSLSKEKYCDNIQIKSNVYEISNLIESINNLSKRLNKQESIRKKLTENMSHELRTPITAIQANLEAMSDGIIKPTKEKLQSCYSEIIRISKLIEKLENLETLQNESKLNLKNTDISLIVKNVLISFEKKIIDKKIAVKFDYTPIIINIDADKMYQVFVNLISNAIKYNKENGKIEIYIKEYQESIKIYIKDSGIGIKKQDLDYIFERLYREDKSRNTKIPGYGIGLSIVKQIITLHSGSIDVQSKSGSGTTFIITLNKE